LACYYEAHQQTELARAAAGSEPAAVIHREIAEHLHILERQVAQLDRASDRTMPVVVQMAPLRLEPRAKAPIIRQLYPDDRVRVQDVKDGWALVEVYEYKSEATTTGWVNRRALRSPH
jgi:Bacterial SH3 domain